MMYQNSSFECFETIHAKKENTWSDTSKSTLHFLVTTKKVVPKTDFFAIGKMQHESDDMIMKQY